MIWAVDHNLKLMMVAVKKWISGTNYIHMAGKGVEILNAE
jgi:hypothetical protein